MQMKRIFSGRQDEKDISKDAFYESLFKHHIIIRGVYPVFALTQ